MLGRRKVTRHHLIQTLGVSVNRVYTCFELEKANELCEALLNAGINSYVIDYSSARAGMGGTIDQLPTVYIRELSQIDEAKKVIVKFYPSVLGEPSRASKTVIRSKPKGLIIIFIINRGQTTFNNDNYKSKSYSLE